MNEKLIRNGERKFQYDVWKEAIVMEGMKGKVVRVFSEIRDWDALSVYYFDDDEVKRREMKLKPIHVSMKEVIEGYIKMFDGFLETRDIIGVGEGSTHVGQFGKIRTCVRTE